LAIPTFDVVRSDVEGFMEELWEFPSALHDGCARSEPRAHVFDDMVGQLSPLERQSIEPRARQVAGGTLRGLQRFLREVPWDEEQMRWTSHQRVADAMGEPEGVVRCDATGLVKKGQESVGGARQYCGPLGKVEKCPGGGLAGEASRQGYALVDTRLCRPEAWFPEAYAARRARCHVPTARAFQSKPPLAAAMLQALARAGLLPFKSLVADGLDGNRPDCLDALETCRGVTALVAIPAETRCWRQRPPTEEKGYP
jgi:SRSO17 transposase